MHKLPSEYKKELIAAGLSSKEAEVLLASRDLVDYFDSVSALGVKDLKILWNYLMGDLSAFLNKDMKSIGDFKFTEGDLKDFCNLVSEGKINSKQAKQVIGKMYLEGTNPNKIVNDLGLEQVSDTQAIEKIVDEVLSANAQSVTDFKAGHDRALGYIVGQVMKASRGKANPSIAKKIILKKING